VENLEKSKALNVDSIKRILNRLKEWEIKPIFASSEFVFDGKKGNYKETDEVNPILLYGKQKVAIEDYIQSQFKDYLIFRLAKV